MDTWSSKTCITFKPAETRDVNKALIQGGRRCAAALGMRGGTQDVELGTQECRKRFNVLHELGHTIGLHHEHQLPSRDNYLTILWNNIPKKSWGNFYKERAALVNTFGVPYDYTSVMHYGRLFFAKAHDKPSMEAKDPWKSYLIGFSVDDPAASPSFSDFKIVNLMYSCSKHCPNKRACRDPGYLNKDCQCVYPDDIEYCKDTGDNCAMMEELGRCGDSRLWGLQVLCPLTCGYCRPRHPPTDQKKKAKLDDNLKTVIKSVGLDRVLPMFGVCDV